MKRVLAVVMLFLTLFTRYSGIQAQNCFNSLALTFYKTVDINTVAVNTPAPEPLASPVPTPVPEAAPPIETTPPPEITPTPAAAPTPEVSPAPTETPAPNATPTPPEPDPGPIVYDLPAFDALSPQAISFKNDMEKIRIQAEKKSGIRSTYGIFVMDLKTGYYYGFNENLTRPDTVDHVPEGYFNSASVIKMFQGYLFCDMMRRGELDSDKTWYDKVTGRKFKLIPMIKSMISYSDNNYCNCCLRIVDNKRSNAVLNRLGIKNSRIYGEISPAVGYSRENNIKRYGTSKRCARITPRDAALILYNVYRGKDSDPYMKALNEGLIGNIYTSRIPTGVRRVSKNYPIAHKTGTNTTIGVYNDAGIVYCKNPYILVALTQGTTSSAGHSFIRSLAEQLTRYYEK